MAKTYIKWDLKAFDNFRNSPKVQSEILARAERVKKQAESFGGEYKADVRPGRKRAHAMVKATDFKAVRMNAKSNILLKSLDAGK